MKLKTIIFDLDGTLVHTTPKYRRIVVKSALSDFGKPTEDSIIDDFWFGSEDDRTKIIKEKWGLSLEQFWPAYRNYDKIKLRRQYTRPYDDADILKELNLRSIKTGVVTAAPLHMIDFEIGLLNHDFDVVVRAQLTSGIKPKPSPQGIEKCLEILSSSKKESCYVGDSKTDMETAQSAGVPGILVDRGEYDFGNIDCFLKVSSLYSLRELI